MSTTMRLTDHAIRTALTPAAEVHAPAGLADGIRTAIGPLPQRRAGIFGGGLSGQNRLVLRLVVVGLLVLGLLAALSFVGSPRPPSLVPATAATYHGGPERSGVMPGPGPAGDPRMEWEVAVKGAMGAWSPAVVDGTVYVGDEGGFVTAIDEVTHATRWQHEVGAPINSAISVADGLVIVGADDGVVHALDVATGNERWAYTTGGPVHSGAAVVDGVAYFGSTDGHLYALDVATGQDRWPPVATPGSVSRAVAAAAGVAYVGSGGATAADAGTLGAYDTATGSLIWSAPLEPGNTTTPTVVDGRVYVAGGLDSTGAVKHQLYAFDTATHRSAWAAPFSAPTGATLLLGAVAHGLVFVESYDGTLYVVDARTGALAWTAPIHATQSPNGGLVGNVFYATGDDRKVHAIDIESHDELWSFGVNGTPTAPAIVNGRVIVGTSLGKVVSISGTNDESRSGSSGGG